ncbi:MAG: helix-turn-helix transcriptional regulator [Peptococcaceae bacterium]|nr:helix-turn-helix transcriptional regulator [Candidatus Syntrophopropionicum ammoniitolerans]
MYHRLRERREKLGITQEEISEKLGFKSKNAYSLKERGLRKIYVNEAFEIAKILGCSIGDLFYIDGVNKRVTPTDTAG